MSSGVSDQARHKPACAATEASYSLEIWTIVSRDIILSKQRTTKALIRLRGCAGSSAPLLFAYGIRHIFSWPGSFVFAGRFRSDNMLLAILGQHFWRASFCSVVLNAVCVTFCLPTLGMVENCFLRHFNRMWSLTVDHLQTYYNVTAITFSQEPKDFPSIFLYLPHDFRPLIDSWSQ